MKLPVELLLTPFILQGGLMVVDEFYFHEKRSLKKWESIGHPLDSLTVFSCFLFLILSAPSSLTLQIYAGLSIFSCLFITKDEWVHAKECSGSENWVHALLFVVHPLIFASAWFLKEQGETLSLVIQTTIIGIFMIYQIVRWNIWQEAK